MGFFSKVFKSFKSILPAAGTAVGTYFGGAAGGAFGGAVGTALAGSSAQGLTVPKTGGAQGVQAREYYNEAFPGTNPWERLGAGNPIGQAMTAQVQDNSSKRMARTQSSVATSQQTTQKSIAANQVAVQQSNAQIQGRAAAVAHADKIGSANVVPAGNWIATGETAGGAGPGPGVGFRGVAAQEKQAEAAWENAATKHQEMWIKKELATAHIGKEFSSLTDAAAAAIRARAFRISGADTDLTKWVRENMSWIRGLGLAKGELAGVFQAMGIAGLAKGALKAFKGSQSSVRGMAR